MKTLKDYAKAGYMKGLSDLAADKVKADDRQLTDMEKTVLILVASGTQTYFGGSKNKQTKKRQMTDAGNHLSYDGYMTFKIRGNGYQAEITDKGMALYETLSASDINAVNRQSESQQRRQSERENGQYSMMDTCEYCGKRRGDISVDDENDGVLICHSCIVKRNNGETLTLFEGR